MKRIVKLGLVLGAAVLLGFTGCTVEVNNTGAQNAPAQTSDPTTTTTDPATTTVVLSSISVSGTPAFAASNVFFAGDSCDRYSLSATATYSDSSTKNVSASTRVPESVRNTPGSIVFSYTEDGVTKTFEFAGSFYIAASDALTQIPVVLENYSGTLSGGTYYKFGDFPQTLSAISNYSSDTVYNGWYLGGDGYFYAKIKENAYQTGYKYSNGTDVAQDSANSYKYFKVEPIKWRKLTDSYSGKKLLLAENILVNHRYAAGLNNYENSEIRTYLNGTFWNTAFTASAKSKIDDETDLDNSAASTNPASNPNQWYSGTNDYACGTTKDKIFLLSEKEVTTAEYGFAEYNVYKGDSNGTTESSRIRMITDFAKASGAWQNTTAGYGGWWWLRSPSYTGSTTARNVLYDGGARDNPYVGYTSGGVCPALSLKN